jgi:hypothetical protein
MKLTIGRSFGILAVLAAFMLPAAAEAGWCGGCGYEGWSRAPLYTVEPLVEEAPNVFLTENPYPRVHPYIRCVYGCGYYYYRPPYYFPPYYAPRFYAPHYYAPRYYRHYLPRYYRHYAPRYRRYYAPRYYRHYAPRYYRPHVYPGAVYHRYRHRAIYWRHHGGIEHAIRHDIRRGMGMPPHAHYREGGKHRMH